MGLPPTEPEREAGWGHRYCLCEYSVCLSVICVAYICVCVYIYMHVWCICMLCVCVQLLGIHFSLATVWIQGHAAAAALPLSDCLIQHDIFSSNSSSNFAAHSSVFVGLVLKSFFSASLYLSKIPINTSGDARISSKYRLVVISTLSFSAERPNIDLFFFLNTDN